MIVKMKKLNGFLLKSNSTAIMKELAALGVTELRSTEEYAEVKGYENLLFRSDLKPTSNRLNILKLAIDNLSKYVPFKKGFLSPYPEMSVTEFESNELSENAVKYAVAVNARSDKITALLSIDMRLQTALAIVLPFKKIDIPLTFEGGKDYISNFGGLPKNADIPAIELALSQKAPEAQLIMAEMGEEQQFVVIVAHSCCKEAANNTLKSYGFTRVSFKDVTGNAADSIARLNKELTVNAAERANLTAELKELANHRNTIEAGYDLAAIRLNRHETTATLAATGKTMMLEGFLPQECQPEVEGVLRKNGAAFEFSEPTEHDRVPILFKNNAFVKPFQMVTDLYALPTYNSIIDPNPTMAPFFFLFFGIMMGDLAYGIIIALAAFVILKKAKPREGAMKSLMQLGLFCGISTMVWGLLFGSFFGDLIPSLSKFFTGTELIIKPIWFDPLSQPMIMFGLALVMGAIQLALGMALNGYRMIKQGDTLGAVFDIGFWYMLFIGFGVCAVNVNAGLIVAGISALGILLTAGRAKQGVVGKLMGGLGALYGITGYLADLLSYSRLLALGLATAVIAKVMNTMGTMGGNNFVGWLLLVAIFIVGHTFNVAINVLGTFVHTSRLQYIEFFGKFYEPGGKPFKPFFNKTKYVNVVKD